MQQELQLNYVLFRVHYLHSLKTVFMLCCQDDASKDAEMEDVRNRHVDTEDTLGLSNAEEKISTVRCRPFSSQCGFFLYRSSQRICSAQNSMGPYAPTKHLLLTFVLVPTVCGL